MEFITHTAVAIFTGYLAFTNTLAGYITNVLPPTEIAFKEANGRDTTTLPTLPTSLGAYVTDILKKSAEYQRAAVSESLALPAAPAGDPRLAVVNIVCTFKTKEFIRTTTGTGFFVHQNGVVLTNAHVAQYLLLAKTTALGKADCVVKDNDKATPDYVADLLYIPPSWIKANAESVAAKIPMGTGERDYALLYITSAKDRDPMPARFPALTLDETPLSLEVKETGVAAIGFPAPQGARTNTFPILTYATTSISDVFTFSSSLADVISIRGSLVGASGASGGPVINQSDKVIGVITTRGNDAEDGVGSLRAITISHIARTIEEETGFTLTRNIGGDVPNRAEIFNKTMVPFLLTFLTSELDKAQ